MSEAAAAGEQPLVSVVIPTCERPDLLRETLAAAVGQSYRNLEIIVHDNASAADPTPIVAAFADPRIRLYRNPTNIGQTANLAAGLAKCNGKYIALLGDDDVWDRDLIAALAAPLERHPEAVIAFCDHEIIGPDGRVDVAETERCSRRFGRHRLAPGLHRPFARIALKDRSICTLSGALLRRHAADWADLPSEVWTGGDLYLAYLGARTGGACFYVKRRLMRYRYHSRSFSTQVRRVLDVRMRSARSARYYWARFLRDPAITEARTYIALKCAYSMARVVVLTLRRGWSRASATEHARSRRARVQ